MGSQNKRRMEWRIGTPLLGLSFHNQLPSAPVALPSPATACWTVFGAKLGFLQVKALFDEMTTSSLSPSLISYNTLLHAYAKMGAWQESLALLQHLCSR